MTQKEKFLLLRDLCARLPYKVVINVTEPGEDKVNFNCFLGPDIIKEITSEIGHFKYKPYLRPMSSMTGEERGELRKFCKKEEGILYDIGISSAINAPAIIDYLNAHHFDYRNLIEKGLVLEAPEGMY